MNEMIILTAIKGVQANNEHRRWKGQEDFMRDSLPWHICVDLHACA